ncbi:MAG: hypothetical protein Q9227_006411 [Pyrenula ochraceoflavens]
MSQDPNRPGGPYGDPRQGGQYPPYAQHPEAAQAGYPPHGGRPTDHPGQYPPFPTPAQWSQAAFPPPSGPMYHPEAQDPIFHMDCVFTPVSSQAQTFVPAHVAYPHITNGQTSQQSPGTPNQPPQLYGAHGQPLPPDYVQQDNRNSPNYGSYTSQGGYPHAQGDGRGGSQHGDERQRGPERRESSNATSGGYDYGDPTNIAPISPHGPPVYTSQPPPSQASYYNPQPRRGSPQSTYSHEPPRSSNSPHGSTSSTAGGYRSAIGVPPGGRTPPPGAAGSNPNPSSGRNGMSVRDMLGTPSGADSGPGRPQTDNDMLNKLNRGARR